MKKLTRATTWVAIASAIWYNNYRTTDLADEKSWVTDDMKDYYKTQKPGPVSPGFEAKPASGSLFSGTTNAESAIMGVNRFLYDYVTYPEKYQQASVPYSSEFAKAAYRFGVYAREYVKN